MSSENGSCYPEQDLYLEETLIYLSEIKDGKQAKFYFENDIISRYDLRVLYYWGLIDVYGCSCIRKTTLGNKLLYKYFETWNKGRYSKPLFKEAVYGTLKELFERDSDFKKRLIELLQRRKEQKYKISSSDNNQTKELQSVSAVNDSPAVPSVPIADIPAAPAVSNSPDVLDCLIPVPCVASRKDVVTSCTAEVKPAPDTQTEILRELKAFRKEQKQQGEQQTEILQQSLEVQRQNIHQCKIDSLDKIPLLDKESGEWLIASDYARTRKPPITVDTLKQGRSNVKNNNGNTKGLIAEDGSCGIHGKHVWRLGGYDKNNNEHYYYYKYGVDGKYTP